MTTPYRDQEPPVEPLAMEALLADRDAWKAIADERWKEIVALRSQLEVAKLISVALTESP